LSIISDGFPILLFKKIIVHLSKLRNLKIEVRGTGRRFWVVRNHSTPAGVLFHKEMWRALQSKVHTFAINDFMVLNGNGDLGRRGPHTNPPKKIKYFFFGCTLMSQPLWFTTTLLEVVGLRLNKMRRRTNKYWTSNIWWYWMTGSVTKEATPLLLWIRDGKFRLQDFEALEMFRTLAPIENLRTLFGVQLSGLKMILRPFKSFRVLFWQIIDESIDAE